MRTNLLTYLEETVRVVPDKIAFFDENGGLSFRQLYDQARGIGSFLYRAGYYAQPVVVLMQRSPRAIAAFLGAIYAGCWYVPLDAEMPRSRLEQILQELTPGALLCDGETEGLARSLAWKDGIFRYEEAAFGAIDEEPLRGIRWRQLDIDPVYVVFTSGSTGTPKGVVGCHRSVIDYIEQLCTVMGFDENTVFGSQTPLYVDACLKEILPTLKYGASTCLISRQLFSFPVQLVEFLNEQRINTLCWVVSALTMLSAVRTFDRVKPRYVHTVAFASEVLPVRQLNRWRQALPHARFLNLYGPTEATGICCYYEVDRDFSEEESLPLGQPFPNTQILLLDENGQQAAPGAQGEICVRGSRLTLGYYRAPEQTERSFVQNPLNSAYFDRIYRTGDLGRINERGELVFLGRKDQQVKHMGHRVELGEIEAAALRHPQIQSGCCVHDGQSGRLVLYYAGALTTGELALWLREKLPRYMVPNRLVKLAALPLTPNGKVDRVRLQQADRRE